MDQVSLQTTSPTFTWSRSFPGRADQVSTARGFLNEVMDGFSHADDAALCLSELAANAVLHSDSGQPDKHFTVCIKVHPGCLRVEVVDDGGPWNPRRGLSDQGGHGLLIVDRLASCWGIEVHGKAGRTVWFEMVSDPAKPLGELIPRLSPGILLTATGRDDRE
jgi:anti-sigma regulatory factor (Ser/Thr protein kinase)